MSVIVKEQAFTESVLIDYRKWLFTQPHFSSASSEAQYRGGRLAGGVGGRGGGGCIKEKVKERRKMAAI